MWSKVWNKGNDVEGDVRAFHLNKMVCKPNIYHEKFTDRGSSVVDMILKPLWMWNTKIELNFECSLFSNSALFSNSKQCFPPIHKSFIRQTGNVVIFTIHQSTFPKGNRAIWGSSGHSWRFNENGPSCQFLQYEYRIPFERIGNVILASLSINLQT